MALQVGPCVRCGYTGSPFKPNEHIQSWCLLEEGWVCNQCYPKKERVEMAECPQCKGSGEVPVHVLRS